MSDDTQILAFFWPADYYKTYDRHVQKLILFYISEDSIFTKR